MVDPLNQPKGIHHKFQSKLVFGNVLHAEAFGIALVQSGLTGLSCSKATAPVSQFSVGTGTETNVIAKGPIVQIVQTFPSWFSKGRNFVAPIALGF